MTNKQTTLSPRGRFWFGLLVATLGLMPMLATFDIGWLDSSDISGPPWLGFASGGVFIAGGLAVIAGHERPVINGVLVLLMLAGLAAIANWIAFGFGQRVCGGSMLGWSAGDLTGLSCRVPFGIGAVVLNAILCFFVVVTLQGALGGPPRLEHLRKGAEGLILLSLAPILVPMFLILFVRIAFGVVKARVTTGQWPRNKAFIERQRMKGLLKNDPDTATDTDPV